MQRTFRVTNWLWIVMLVAGLLLIGGATALAATSAPASGSISGVVETHDGAPLPAGTLVKLFDTEGRDLVGQATPDALDGSFNLGPVRNGLYVIKAVPPEASGYTQSLPVAVSIAFGDVHVGVLELTAPQITGTVFAPDGSTPAAALVEVHSGDGRLIQSVDAPAGTYAIGGLPAGSYVLRALRVGQVPYDHSPRYPLTINAGEAITQDMLLTEAQLFGTVADELGNPIAWARVIVANASEWQMRISDGQGYWALGGLPDGDSSLSALPPLRAVGLLPSPRQEVTIPGAVVPMELVLPFSEKIVEGSVLTNTGVPVELALIEARRIDRPGMADGMTDASGAYQLNLSPGLWALAVRSQEDTNPADWVYKDGTRFVFFRYINDPQTEVVNFEVLLADATVSGIVHMPDGSLPTQPVTVAFYNDEGLGQRTQIDLGDGSFSLRLPNGGYEVFLKAEDERMLAPVLDPVVLPPNGSLDMGIITLLPRDALIQGQVLAEDGGVDVGVEGIDLIAWRGGAAGNLRVTSGPDGLYALPVSAGEWKVRPAPAPDQPYPYTGGPAVVTLAAGETQENVNFRLSMLDALLNGVLVDEAGEPLRDASGWANAWVIGQPELHNTAPIEDGAFSMYVPSGSLRVSAVMPPGSPYLSVLDRDMVIAAGETLTITLTVKEATANIAGALVDPRDPGQPVTGVPGIAGGWSQGAWSAAVINSGNGTFNMDAAGGIWKLSYRIQSEEYVRLAWSKNVPVQDGHTALVSLPVTVKDAQLAGTVLDPHGNPLAGARVIVNGLGPQLDNVWLEDTSADDGSFLIALPYGRYRLAAAYRAEDWIQPAEVLVSIDPGELSDGHVLQFQEPDAVLSGTITIPNTGAEGTVYVWAWSKAGGFAHGRFPAVQSGGQATADYSLNLLQGETWMVGAVFETPSAYWNGRASILIDEAAETLSFSLDGPKNKPAPVAIRFDASQPAQVELADGTLVSIPAGAMPVEGEVTLRVVPIVTLPDQLHARVVEMGYAILATDADGLPIEASFNQDVVIRFRYNEAALKGIPEWMIRPAYFSTTEERWTLPESYVIDADANTLTLNIDHFTDFSIVTEGQTVIYLPGISR